MSPPPERSSAIARALASEDPETRARRALREKYAATIRRLWIEPDDCPICGSNTWGTGDLVQTELRPPISPLASLAAPAQVYVYVPVTCNICGYSMFFNSGVLDVRDQEKVKAKPPIRTPRPDRQ